MNGPARLRRTVAGALRAMLDAAAECRAHGLDDDADTWTRLHDVLDVRARVMALEVSQTRRVPALTVIDGGVE